MCSNSSSPCSSFIVHSHFMRKSFLTVLAHSSAQDLFGCHPHNWGKLRCKGDDLIVSMYYGLAAAHLNPIYHQDHTVIPFYTHSISNNENILAYECWQDRYNEDIICCWGSINSPISLENTHFSVKVNTNMPHDPAILLPALCPRDAMHIASGD